LIDTNVIIHLAALDLACLPDEMVISAITLDELLTIVAIPRPTPTSP
jgi:predicted nucleic acid-binding protein